VVLRLAPVILLLLLSQINRAAVPGGAVRGIYDLRNADSEKVLTVKLNGEWEFYWNKLYHPNDFRTKSVVPDYYVHVPSYWTDYPDSIVGKGNTGCATYRLTIFMPEGFRTALGFDVPVFDSAYDLWLNGEYFGGNGVPGCSAAEEVPEYRRNFFRYIPDSDTLTLIINVSNHNHRRGGFWLPLRIGTFSEVQGKLANGWAGDWITISLLLGFSLFFLFFFIINPEEKVMGYFAIATIGLALRPLFTAHFLIGNFGTLSWIWLIRFEYLSLYLTLIGWYWFLNYLYPARFFSIISWIIGSVYMSAFVLTLFLPVKIFSYTTIIYYPAMVVLMVYSLTGSIAGILKRNYIDIAYLAAFLLLVAGGIHDIKVSMGRSESSAGYLLSYIVVAFVFIQAALLLYRWVKSFREKEKLRSELEYMNRNLELLVQERTAELQLQKNEIEKQNEMIATQNKQLSETINLKNKMFSVVAHDLRSPVVNILYMLNLLKEKEYREKFDTFAETSIEYAQRVISLLENMLVWGRGQEEKIKYSPEKLNLADLILTNLSIFKESADKKEISVNFTQVGNSYALIDRDLADIIIRNILSNAVKYTYRGGRISILLKDKKNEGGGILLKICDNGIGMSAGVKDTLFTQEGIQSIPGTENEKGTGLGLKLVNELVKINKGTLEIESREGEGTCISISFPQ
jgi:signal transduction histidine kinase